MKFYGQYNPPVDRFIYERYFGASLLKGTYVECGASDGIGESSCFFFEETLGWRAINIEASPPLFDMLRQNRPNSLNIHAALSDDEGEVEFTHAYHPQHGAKFGNGSVAHTALHRAELDSMGCTYETFKVPAMTYRDIIDRHGVKNVDLMVLDVEGHEAAALRGMTGAVTMPMVMCVEDGISGKDVIREIMANLGYAFDTESFGNAFYVRNNCFEAARRLVTARVDSGP